MERIYAETLRHYPDIKHYWQIPLQLTLRNGFDGGMLGPYFLLVPCGLLALRFKSGRRLLLAGLVFALPAYLNVGTRFLIPSVPFLALAMGIGLADVPAALPVLALFHALVSLAARSQHVLRPVELAHLLVPRPRCATAGSHRALSSSRISVTTL